MFGERDLYFLKWCQKKKCTSSKMELNPIFLFRMLGRSTYARKTKIMTILFLLLLTILCYCTKTLPPLWQYYATDNWCFFFCLLLFLFFFSLFFFFFWLLLHFHFYNIISLYLIFFSYILMNLPKLTSINMGLNFQNWLAKYSYWFWPVVIMIF